MVFLGVLPGTWKHGNMATNLGAHTTNPQGSAFAVIVLVLASLLLAPRPAIQDARWEGTTWMGWEGMMGMGVEVMVILLMIQKSQGQPPFGCIKLYNPSKISVNHGINYQPQLLSRISEPLTVFRCSWLILTDHLRHSLSGRQLFSKSDPRFLLRFL